jgi:hypothetical protein
LGITPEHEAGTPQDVPFATGVWQTPPRHVSSVQEFPSLPQPVPFATAALAHPVAGAQVSLVHAFPSLQFAAGPG